MKRSRSNAITTLLALGIGAGALVLALRGTDLEATGDAIAQADATLFVACLVCLFASYLARAVRWHMLLRGPDVQIPLMATYEASSLGYLLNNVLPARAGDVIRSIALKRRAGVSRSFGFATTVAERSGDALWLASLTLLLAMTSQNVPRWLAESASVVLAGALVVIAFLALGYAKRRSLVRWVRSRHLGGRSERIEHLVRHGGNGLSSLGHPRRAAGFMGITAGIWFLDGFSLMFAVASVGSSVSFDAALLTLCALGLASAAPSTPGYVGIFQLVAVSVLPAFGVERHDALAAIVVFQVAILLEVVICGVPAAWRLRIGIREVRDAEEADAAEASAREQGDQVALTPGEVPEHATR